MPPARCGRWARISEPGRSADGEFHQPWRAARVMKFRKPGRVPPGPHPSSPQEADMNKKYVIFGSVVVAAVIGFVALRGVYPPKTNVEGAIGGANRYESAQISE